MLLRILAALMLAVLFVVAPASAEGVAKTKKLKMEATPVEQPAPQEQVVEAIKAFQPYVYVHAGLAATYSDGKVGGFKDGGFDAAPLLGGGAGFTSRLGAQWFWGLEANAEWRLQSQHSTPISLFFHGGDLKYTAAIDGLFGVNMTSATKIYAKGGYRWGWSDDMVGNFSGKSFNVPTKGGFETGLGMSHDLAKNLAWDLNAMVWFPNDETATSTIGPLRLDGSDLTVRTGLKLQF